jgi:hypothetical protein
MISRDDAVTLAREEVVRKGLVWTEPATVNFGFWNFRVWTRGDSRGGNIIIRVNRRSGAATIMAVTPK